MSECILVATVVNDCRNPSIPVYNCRARIAIRGGQGRLSIPSPQAPLISLRVNAEMGSNLPKEFQKNYTWDAIVFSDGATYVSSIARAFHPPVRSPEGFPRPLPDRRESSRRAFALATRR